MIKLNITAANGIVYAEVEDYYYEPSEKRLYLKNIYTIDSNARIIIVFSIVIVYDVENFDEV